MPEIRSPVSPRPLGREAAMDGALHQIAVLEWSCGEARKALGKAKRDDGKLSVAAYTIWALHLIPLAGFRMLSDYLDEAPVDHRPEAASEDDPRQQERRQAMLDESNHKR